MFSAVLFAEIEAILRLTSILALVVLYKYLKYNIIMYVLYLVLNCSVYLKHVLIFGLWKRVKKFEIHFFRDPVFRLGLKSELQVRL